MAFSALKAGVEVPKWNAGIQYFVEHQGFQGLNYFAHIGRRKMVICRVVVLLSHIKVAEDGIGLRCNFLGGVAHDGLPLISKMAFTPPD